MCIGLEVLYIRAVSLSSAENLLQTVTQYQGEALRGGSPSLDCCQRPLLHHILCLLIHSHH